MGRHKKADEEKTTGAESISSTGKNEEPSAPVQPTEPGPGQDGPPVQAPAVVDAPESENQAVDSSQVPALVATSPDRKRRKRRTQDELAREREAEAQKLAVQQSLERKARLDRAKMAAQGLVATLDVVAGRYLPPPLTDDEKSLLADAWAPVVAMYEAELIGSPWFGAAIATAAVYLPRYTHRREYAAPAVTSAPRPMHREDAFKAGLVGADAR